MSNDCKNHCDNCKYHSATPSCDSDGYNVWEEHFCSKRYEETEDVIDLLAYRKVPKRCFELDKR